MRARLARIAPFLVTALILVLPTLDALGATGFYVLRVAPEVWPAA